MKAAPTKAPRPLAPKGGNDKIQTPDYLAKQIVQHFQPSGKILEPCRGGGAFTRAIPNCYWCEIDDGRNFFTWCEPGSTHVRFDWIITNPPWSQFREFLIHSMKLADNVVFLCLTNAWFMKARRRDMREAGFGLVEILELEQPKKPWPQAGFELSAGWARRGWTGGTYIHQLPIIE